jgi:hypothetical protein
MRSDFRFVFRLIWLGSLAAANAQEAPTPPAAGPIAIDMSIDAAKKAAPGVAWADVASEKTGKTIGVQGKDVWSLEGHAYAIGLQPRAYGAATLAISGRHKVESADVCRVRVVALAKHFGAYFVTLAPRAPGLDLTVSDSRIEIIEAGANAKVRETRITDQTTVWEFGQETSDAYPYSIQGEARFKDAEAPEDAETCDIYATLKAHPVARPAFEMLDAKIKPVTLPSAALLHESIDGLLLPVSGVTLSFTCGIDRATGKLWGCGTGAEKKTPEERAGQRRLDAYVYDPKKLDPDNDVPLRTTISVKLSPNDRDAKRLAAALAVPVWIETATPTQLSRNYPVRALSLGLQARVKATCTIQADYSVACDTIATDPPGLVEFEMAARKVLKFYRAAPLLRNGKPAAGATATIAIRFTIE